VSDQAKGEGIGRTLWDKVTWKHKKLFWRAGVSNPINKFYASVADGFIHSGEWKVYWIGLSGYQEIKACVDFAVAQERTVIGGQST
jgi:acetylglutamate kinase